MAILRDGKRGKIGPSLRGQFYTYEKNGTWVMAAWPAKRTAKPTADLKASQDLFREACRAMKFTHSAFQVHARVSASGTPFLPRDALIAAMYGKGPTIYTQNGERRIPMASRLDMSMLLDNLAFKPGSLLIRNVNTWVGLDPSETGYVLTYDADQGEPIWSPPQTGGGGGGSTWLAGTITNYASPRVGKGTVLTPQVDFNLNAVYVLPNTARTMTLQASVWRLSSAVLVEEMGRSIIQSRAFLEREKVKLEFEEPPLLAYGQRYLVIICRTDGDGFQTWDAKYTDEGTNNRPWTGLALAKYMTAQPALGARYSDDGSGSFMCFADWSL